MLRGLAVSITLSLCALFSSADARAEPNPDTSARADALFARGKAEMTTGEYAAACVLFGESYALDPSEGTLLALGLCHEQEGRLVQAFGELRDAHGAAVTTRRQDRQRVALTALARIQPAIGRIGLRGKRCTALTLDGKPVAAGEATVERPLPVEPGTHKVACVDWSTETRVDRGALAVIALAEVSAVAPAPAPAPAPSEDRPRAGAGSGRALGWVLGAAGVASLGAGTFFGVRAFSRWDAVESKCAIPSACRDRSALTDERDARTAATVANVTIIAGTLMAVAAIYFIATTPRAH